jgi:hypothetical protein
VNISVAHPAPAAGEVRMDEGRGRKPAAENNVMPK